MGLVHGFVHHGMRDTSLPPPLGFHQRPTCLMTWVSVEGFCGAAGPTRSFTAVSAARRMRFAFGRKERGLAHPWEFVYLV